MASFDSPLGTKRLGGLMNQFTVDEPGEPNAPNFNMNEINAFNQRMGSSQGDFSEDEDRALAEEIRRAKIEKQNGKVRLDPGARQRIEILLGMTRLKKEVNIEGELFGLQTLRSKELNDVMMQVMKCASKVEELFEMRRQILCRSICSIAGADFGLFVGSNTIEDKLYFIDQQDHNFLTRLYLEYTQLNAESEQKYAIKSPEDAAEVAEDIKK